MAELRAKGGMHEVDIGEVNAYIAAVTKGSRFARAQEKRKAALQARVDALVGTQLRALDPRPDSAEAADARRKVAEAVADIEARRDLARTWLHVDMDAFYCAVEELDRPELRGKPLAVGTLDMLQTSSYEARRWGIRAGMPGFIAVTLCPQLEIVAPRLDRYREVSRAIHEGVFAKFDEAFVPISLDEASIEVTNGSAGGGKEAAAALQDEVARLFGGAITCSVGVAHTATLAKMAAQVRKPAGIFAIAPTREATLEFLSGV
jgi:DNA polymerase kappa